MLAMPNVTAPAPKTTPRTQPPHNRWRNVYWLAKAIELAEAPGHPAGRYGPGRFAPRTIWPSRDIAEDHARRCIARAADREHIVYLGAEESGFTTGQVFPIDGGWSI